MIPKSDHTPIFPNWGTDISPSTQMFMLETWESILTALFSHSQSLTGSYLLELSYVILRIFCFPPYLHMPPIDPATISYWTATIVS